MKQVATFATVLVLAVAFFPTPAAAQLGPGGTNAESTSYSMTGPNVVGSNGVLYQTTSQFSYSIKGLFGASTSNATSTLYSYDPTSVLPDKKLSFTGFATALAIGKDDRLFLIVGKNLYLIPTPLPAALNAPIEQMAVDVTNAPSVPAAFAASNILRITLASAPISLGGSAYSVKVKAVGSKEYLYLDTFEFTWSPFKFSSKVLILDSLDGKKVREITVD